MPKNRLEAFSDGVLAVIITIMVLELKVPEGTDLHAMASMLPVLSTYVLSFIFIGIYWNNHHHLLHAVRQINGRIMWANLHLLFWLSLIPAGTAWLGRNPRAPLPTATYGVLLLLAAIAYFILERTIIAAHGRDSELARAVGSELKGWLSEAIYALAILCAFLSTWISDALYLVVALMWLRPDPRIERRVGRGGA